MARRKKQSTVRANIKENRLYITLIGVVPKKEAESLYTEIRFCVSDLTPGFSVITDISNCNLGHLSAISTSKKIMDFLLEKQVGKVVRVLGNSRTIYLQIARLTDTARGYSPIYMQTLEEAKQYLDSEPTEDNSSQPDAA